MAYLQHYDSGWRVGKRDGFVKALDVALKWSGYGSEIECRLT